MVVVVDTNVLVSALLGPGGASRDVIRACLTARLSPLMGVSLFAEYEEVLAREDLFARSGLSFDERHTVLNAFLSVCRWTRVYFRWRPNLPDEADNHVIELAVAGNANAIITKNVRHFRRAELPFPSLRIVSPDDMAKELRS